MLQFTVDPAREPDGASLRRLLEAHVVCERMASAKRASLHLLAVVGIVVWLGAAWPSLISAQLLDAALALWALLLFLAILATVEEWLWQRKVARYRAEQQRKSA
jgi:hypothetical protein